jgi:hypothetical protein
MNDLEQRVAALEEFREKTTAAFWAIGQEFEAVRKRLSAAETEIGLLNLALEGKVNKRDAAG